MTGTIVLNDLELRVSREPALIEAAQRLRYRVFYEEMGARPDARASATRLDADPFDALADHIVVRDRRHATGGTPRVIGCYRLLRGTVAGSVGGFYSAGEFELQVFADRLAAMVELGRSCVDPDYRNGTVMQLLWRGIALYLERHGLTLMLGCGRAHSPAAICRCRPPLLKAYLRMGGLIGDGAVIDHAFNTVDVCLVLPTERLKDRYLRHLAMPERAHAAAA